MSITSQSRIEIIDVLRGFALAGILYAHMIIWYTGAALPQEVYLKYDTTADGIAMGVFGALILSKFFSVFSFLFGLGFYLYFQKKRFRRHYLSIYLWRLFLLFLIGLLHHILWRGDILVIYAVLGSLLLLFRHLSSRYILLLAVIFIFNIPNHVLDAFQSTSTDASLNLPMEEDATNYYSLVRGADLKEVLKENWKSWPAKINYQLESGRLLMTFGYFLLGLFAGIIKFFTSLDKNLSIFRKWNKITKIIVFVLLITGWLMYLYDLVTIPEIKMVPQLKWVASFLFSIYNACLTIFYITGITLLYRKRYYRHLFKPLATMGRIALTNYLLQTAFGLLLFYQFGLGLFDKTSPAMNVIMSCVVFFVQLKLSQYWLTYYEQGPIEWLWRSLTHFRFSSNKKRASH